MYCFKLKLRRGYKLCLRLCCAYSLSHVRLFVTLWTVAHWATLSRQEYCSGLSCPPPGDLPNLGIEPRSPILQVDFLPAEPPGKHINNCLQHHSVNHGHSPVETAPAPPLDLGLKLNPPFLLGINCLISTTLSCCWNANKTLL